MCDVLQTSHVIVDSSTWAGTNVGLMDNAMHTCADAAADKQ